MNKKHFFLLTFLCLLQMGSSAQKKLEFKKRVVTYARIYAIRVCPNCCGIDNRFSLSFKGGLDTNKKEVIELKVSPPDVDPTIENLNMESTSSWDSAAHKYDGLGRDTIASIDSVAISLIYYKNSDMPRIDWIAKKDRVPSIESLKKYLQAEAIISSVEASSLLRLSYLSTNSLAIEEDAKFYYCKDGESYVAIESPIGSGNWQKYVREDPCAQDMPAIFYMNPNELLLGY